MSTTFTHTKDNRFDVDVSYAFEPIAQTFDAEHVKEYLAEFKKFLLSIGFQPETVACLKFEDAKPESRLSK